MSALYRYFYENISGKRPGPKVTVRLSQVSALDHVCYRLYMNCNFDGWPQNYLTTPRSRSSEQLCSIVLGLLFSFSEKFAQGHTRSWCRNVCGSCFEICNVYEIVANDWLYCR